MKLFLASSLDKTLHLLAEVAPSVGKRVLFVQNAAEPWVGKMELFWVNADREAFKKLGYEVAEVDLHQSTPESLREELRNSNILHICGGGVFYINELIKEKNLHSVIADAVVTGGVLYTGTSAGSIIASKKFSHYEPEPEEAEMIKHPEDKVGLGLVDFIVVPHNNQPDSVAIHKEMVPRMVNYPEALFFITDKQAFWVDDASVMLLQA